MRHTLEQCLKDPPLTVYVNDEKIGTTYVSGNELWIKASKVDDGDKVVVNQNGSKSTIFRSSNEFVYSVPIADDQTDTQTTENTENTENTDEGTP